MEFKPLEYKRVTITINHKIWIKTSPIEPKFNEPQPGWDFVVCHCGAVSAYPLYICPDCHDDFCSECFDNNCQCTLDTAFQNLFSF